MVRRLRQTHQRAQLQTKAPAIRLVNTLVNLGEQYGKEIDEGIEIHDFGNQDLASISGVKAEEASKVMQKLLDKGWIKRDPDRQVTILANFKQLSHLAEHS
jgi:CRP-like cAMP-binding protein